MKKLFKKLWVFTIYCFGYLSIVNISASAINNSLDTLTLNEIVSIQGMRSGQKDIFTFLKIQINNIDIESIREEVIQELKNM
jgi:hypothetical protein